MRRTIVQVARIRLGDVEPGDIINGRPDTDHGWFVVEMIRELPSGDLVVTGASTADNVKATPWDLVGIQVTKKIEIPSAWSEETRSEVIHIPLPDDHDRAATERVPATTST